MIYRLTVTKVVFEYYGGGFWKGSTFRLTVTKVVFELSTKALGKLRTNRLTVTKVVFELEQLQTQIIYNLTINSNKGCFWIERYCHLSNTCH